MSQEDQSYEARIARALERIADAHERLATVAESVGWSLTNEGEDGLLDMLNPACNEASPLCDVDEMRLALRVVVEPR